MDGIPPVLTSDSEDVAWALQTAEALWKRGERVDAIVWLRRAAQAAGEAEDDNRAVMLARNAAELTDWIAHHTMASAPPEPGTGSHQAVDDLLGDLPRPPESETFSLGIPSVVSSSELEAGLRPPSRGPSVSDPRDARGTLTSDSEVMTISLLPGDVELIESKRPSHGDEDDEETHIEVGHADLSDLDAAEIEMLPSDPPPRAEASRDDLSPVPTAQDLHAGMLDPWSDPERRSALPQPPTGSRVPAPPPFVKLKGSPSRFDDEEVVTSAKVARAIAPRVDTDEIRTVPRVDPADAPTVPRAPPPLRPPPPRPPPIALAAPTPPRRPPPMRAIPREDPAPPQDEPVTAQFAKVASYPPAQASRSIRAPSIEPHLEAIEKAVVSESPLSLSELLTDDTAERSTMDSPILAPPPPPRFPTPAPRVARTPIPPTRPRTPPPVAPSVSPLPPSSPPDAPRPRAPRPFGVSSRPPPSNRPSASIAPSVAPTAPPPRTPFPRSPLPPSYAPPQIDEPLGDDRATPVPDPPSEMPRGSHSKMPTPPVPSSRRDRDDDDEEDATTTRSQPPFRRSPPPGQPAAQPTAPQSGAQLELSSIEALGDLPDEAREEFARVARIEVLAKDEEVSNFALALVLEGEVDISSPLVDAPALRLERNSILRSRGTLEDGVQLRLVCASEGARVATWNDAAVDAAFRSCPWVEEDLRALADVVQTKVGVTMGPLGERFDMGLREHVTSRLLVRNLAPGEEIATQGKLVSGLIVIGVGEIDLLTGDVKSGVLRSGDFLFPNEVLSSGKAPATARAGKNGALILAGDRRATQELLMSFPPLLEFLAMG